MMHTNIPIDDWIELISTFAEHVCTGTCGQGNQVCAGTIQVAVCAISKTFELDGTWTHYIAPKAATGSNSNDKLKVSDAKIHQHSTNLLSL